MFPFTLISWGWVIYTLYKIEGSQMIQGNILSQERCSWNHTKHGTFLRYMIPESYQAYILVSKPFQIRCHTHTHSTCWIIIPPNSKQGRDIDFNELRVLSLNLYMRMGNLYQSQRLGFHKTNTLPMKPQTPQIPNLGGAWSCTAFNAVTRTQYSAWVPQQTWALTKTES